MNPWNLVAIGGLFVIAARLGYRTYRRFRSSTLRKQISLRKGWPKEPEPGLCYMMLHERWSKLSDEERAAYASSLKEAIPHAKKVKLSDINRDSYAVAVPSTPRTGQEHD